MIFSELVEAKMYMLCHKVGRIYFGFANVKTSKYNHVLLVVTLSNENQTDVDLRFFHSNQQDSLISIYL